MAGNQTREERRPGVHWRVVVEVRQPGEVGWMVAVSLWKYAGAITNML